VWIYESVACVIIAQQTSNAKGKIDTATNYLPIYPFQITPLAFSEWQICHAFRR